ncbi:hypothetical protein M0534_00850 [Methylonatrum kenyense]|uniref:hypothetical protein n=1 Tax=Methylonatrum kenyense TaxID=455253 RepID=UPI0020BE6379|nr:hypothetical protein [Methylonatrum kenyense]MCK8514880.1 hypothetical protein [Methylonatrum kenyense]
MDEVKAREALEKELAEREAELADALREKYRTEQVDRLQAKQAKGPDLTKLRRNRMTNDEKSYVIQEFGIDVYNKLPL